MQKKEKLKKPRRKRTGRVDSSAITDNKVDKADKLTDKLEERKKAINYILGDHQ